MHQIGKMHVAVKLAAPAIMPSPMKLQMRVPIAKWNIICSNGEVSMILMNQRVAGLECKASHISTDTTVNTIESPSQNDSAMIPPHPLRINSVRILMLATESPMNAIENTVLLLDLSKYQTKPDINRSPIATHMFMNISTMTKMRYARLTNR
jgi:hypothetical protein